MSDIAVIYYSFEGNTEYIAKCLSRFTEADLIKIRPLREPSVKGPGKYIKGGASVFMKSTPEIAPETEDLTGYNTLILCYPIWASSFPPWVNTFLENNEIEGNLYVVTSSKSGRGEKSVENVEEKTGTKVIDSVHLKNPLRDRNMSRKIAETFIQRNGI